MPETIAPLAEEAVTATAEAASVNTAATVETATEVVTQAAATETPSLVQTTAETIIETTSPFIKWIKGFLSWDNLFKFLGIVIFIVLLWLLYKLIVKAIRKAHLPKLDDHKKDLLIRFVKYAIYIIIIIQILGFFGINLSGLWGAAGIAGVALGFAAQTSVSNIISGLFVITEGSLKLGDLIEVDGVKGYVESINLLSVRIHTFDNQMVRIPNSKIIDSNLINISYHKIRRLSIEVSISYDTDMQKALDILATAPALCTTVLKDPEPGVWFDGFGDSGINMTLAVWFNADDYRKTKNDVFIAIKKVFDDARIEIPFNQLDVKIKEEK